ncbi:MAG TPA: hypothetical protein VIE39_07070, partial [Thermoanaerobaculia bacterium]
IDYFQNAIELDPSFALAYSGLAGTYVVLSSYSLATPADGYGRARAAARKALEIDDNLAPAHAALALVHLQYDWDWAGAEAEFRRALAIDPSYATAHFWYSQLSSIYGRHEEALASIRRARQIDPFSSIIAAHEVRTLTWAGRYDEAMARGRDIAGEFPDFPPPHFFLSLAYQGGGKVHEAVAPLRRAAELAAAPQKSFFQGRADALDGRNREAHAALAELESLRSRQYVAATYPATIHAALGEIDRAFFWLEQAYEEHAYELTLLTLDPLFAPIRRDPRYAELVRRIGLPVAKK